MVARRQALIQRDLDADVSWRLKISGVIPAFHSPPPGVFRPWALRPGSRALGLQAALSGAPRIPARTEAWGPLQLSGPPARAAPWREQAAARGRYRGRDRTGAAAGRRPRPPARHALPGFLEGYLHSALTIGRVMTQSVLDQKGNHARNTEVEDQSDGVADLVQTEAGGRVEQEIPRRDPAKDRSRGRTRKSRTVLAIFTDRACEQSIAQRVCRSAPLAVQHRAGSGPPTHGDHIPA